MCRVPVLFLTTHSWCKCKGTAVVLVAPLHTSLSVQQKRPTAKPLCVCAYTCTQLETTKAHQAARASKPTNTASPLAAWELTPTPTTHTAPSQHPNNHAQGLNPTSLLLPPPPRKQQQQQQKPHPLPSYQQKTQARPAAAHDPFMAMTPAMLQGTNTTAAPHHTQRSSSSAAHTTSTPSGSKLADDWCAVGSVEQDWGDFSGATTGGVTSSSTGNQGQPSLSSQHQADFDPFSSLSAAPVAPLASPQATSSDQHSRQHPSKPPVSQGFDLLS